MLQRMEVRWSLPWSPADTSFDMRLLALGATIDSMPEIVPTESIVIL